MSRVRLPDLTRNDLWLGAAIASPIVLLPLLSGYLSRGRLHPDANWRLLALAWMAGSVAFALFFRYLRAQTEEPAPLRPATSGPTAQDRVFRWGERGRSARTFVDLAVLLAMGTAIAAVWFDALPLAHPTEALVGLGVVCALALVQLVRNPYRRAFTELVVSGDGVVLRAAGGRQVALGWETVDRLEFAAPWSDGKVLAFVTRSGETHRFALHAAVGGFPLFSDARVYEVLGAVAEFSGTAGYALSGPRRLPNGIMFAGMNWRILRATAAASAPDAPAAPDAGAPGD